MLCSIFKKSAPAIVVSLLALLALPTDVREIIAAKDRNAAGPKAAACGLTLIRLAYEDMDYERKN